MPTVWGKHTVLRRIAEEIFVWMIGIALIMFMLLSMIWTKAELYDQIATSNWRKQNGWE